MQIQPPILFVGDRDSPEFTPIAQWLAQHSAKFAPSFADATAWIESGRSPAIIVVAQSWPGQFSTLQIDLLRRVAPLARIVSLLGSWLEGEARTGKPWPAVWRTYWHQWLPRFCDEIERLVDGKPSAWSLPGTATDEQRLGRLLAPLAGGAGKKQFTQKVVAVVSATREAAESIADGCQAEKVPSVWLKSAAHGIPVDAALVLFDIRNFNEAELAEVASLKSYGVPVVVVVAFPRASDIELLESHGVSAVLSKPYLHTELIHQIRRHMGGFD